LAKEPVKVVEVAIEEARANLLQTLTVLFLGSLLELILPRIFDVIMGEDSFTNATRRVIVSTLAWSCVQGAERHIEQAKMMVAWLLFG
jgi:positive regulator of sigma E activity